MFICTSYYLFNLENNLGYVYRIWKNYPDVNIFNGVCEKLQKLVFLALSLWRLNYAAGQIPAIVKEH